MLSSFCLIPAVEFSGSFWMQNLKACKLHVDLLRPRHPGSFSSTPVWVLLPASATLRKWRPRLSAGWHVQPRNEVSHARAEGRDGGADEKAGSTGQRETRRLAETRHQHRTGGTMMKSMQEMTHKHVCNNVCAFNIHMNRFKGNNIWPNLD